MENSSNLILVVTNNSLFAEEALTLLDRVASSSFLVKSCSFHDVFRQIEGNPPTCFLIDLAEASEMTYSVIQKISSFSMTSRIACVGHPSDASLVIKLIKIGVKDFLNSPVREDELRVLIGEVVSAPSAAGVSTVKKSDSSGKIITLYSPKGGSGVTLITTNLAVALAQNQKAKVVVCDLSPQCGDVATYLNLTPQYTLRDVIDNQSLLDISFLEGIMVEHSSGVKILAAPRENQDPPNSDHLNTLKSILTLLKQSYNIVLIDGGHLEPTLLQFVMSQSDLIGLVGNPDVVSLKGLIALFNKLKMLHYDTQRIKIIINRHNSKSKIDSKEFENMTKHPIACNLPNNYMLCIEAVNSGQPLSSINAKADLAKKIEDLAEIVTQPMEKGAASAAPSGNSGSASGSVKKGFLRCF